MAENFSSGDIPEQLPTRLGQMTMKDVDVEGKADRLSGSRI